MFQQTLLYTICVNFTAQYLPLFTTCYEPTQNGQCPVITTVPLEQVPVLAPSKVPVLAPSKVPEQEKVTGVPCGTGSGGRVVTLLLQPSNSAQSPADLV